MFMLMNLKMFFKRFVDKEKQHSHDRKKQELKNHGDCCEISHAKKKEVPEQCGCGVQGCGTEKEK